MDASRRVLRETGVSTNPEQRPIRRRRPVVRQAADAVVSRRGSGHTGSMSSITLKGFNDTGEVDAEQAADKAVRRRSSDSVSSLSSMSSITLKGFNDAGEVDVKQAVHKGIKLTINPKT